MIEVRDLVKYYGNFKALDGISFAVKKGEILGFLGPNGAGKTTTMRLITGFIKPTSGKIKVFGYDVSKHPVQVKSSIGYLPETLPLYTEMDVNSYLRYIAEIKAVDYRKIKSRLDEVIDMCSLGSVRKRVIANLSKGFKQRVGIAQALMNDPKLLILDEPTSGLDPKQITEIRKLIKSLASDRTVILSSHILPEVQMTCGRVIIVNNGKIVAEDEQSKLNKRLSSAYNYHLEIGRPTRGVKGFIKGLTGVVNVKESEENKNVFEIESKIDIRPTIVNELVNAGYKILEFRTKDFSLEEVFLKLTTQEDNLS